MLKEKAKLSAGVIISLLLVLFISACSSDSEADEDNAKEGGDEQAEVTLTFLVDNQTVMDGVEAVAAEIKARYNITTEFEIRPGGTEGDNIVKTRLATGEMTDFMWYNSGSLFKALNPEEYFYDLSNESYIGTIDDSFIETVSVDGKVYGIPGASASAGGWLYNSKVYEELGLSVPNTWEELLENNEKVKAAGITPVAGSYKDTWTSQLVFLADYYNVHSELSEFADDYTANKAKIADTPLILRGFEKLQDLHEFEHMNNELSSTSYEDALRMLAEGEAAHYPMLTFALAALNDLYPEQIDDIGFFGQPGDNEDNHGITLWMPGGIYLNKDSEHVEAGKQWMEFFVSPEGMEIYMSTMKADGPYVIKGLELPEDSYQAVKEMVPYINEGRVAPALEFLSPIKGPALEQITVEVGMGFVTAEEGAEKYDRDVEKQAQQLGLEGW
ncbi:raffinose/stachyose/melibiose transport system substrate-binding protein [Evansella caseinilytica]|uniref:Raffinose/stachyose/melibiose transport system substrate-binding protein n=1 Tax=Evansella caseinilytica TaxID=1503961 RepID=A0A1H3IRE5_9BACI|nr:extracellular solute-binding protein [Evansella caseinilytica]SDY30290.1 raffinose/stachyose/melibiose transport system substrate-binding protein [Evansella caseinilytica]